MTIIEQRTMETICHCLPELVNELRKLNANLEKQNQQEEKK